MPSQDKVLKCKPTDQLGSVLDWVQSSHDAILVFDKKNFLGVCSPYQTLYQKSYPYTSLVQHSLIHAPKIYDETAIYDVAEHMTALRIYTLPIFTKNNKYKQTISAKEIIKSVVKDKISLQQVAQNLEVEPTITDNIHKTVKDIYNKLRQRKVTRICLVDKDGKLKGIVTRSDIKHAFIHPTPKQRFAKNVSYPASRSFDEEKKRRIDDPVRNYYTELVYQEADALEKEEIIKRLLRSGRNSVVLIDKGGKPTGMIAISSLLKAIAKLKPAYKVNLIFQKPSESVDEYHVEEGYSLLQKFSEKINQRMPLERIELHLDEPKYSDRQTAQFRINLRVMPIAGNSLISLVKNKSFIEGLHAAMRQIEKQLKKRGALKRPSRYKEDPLIKPTVHP